MIILGKVMTELALVVAHYGGIDEIGMFVIPAVAAILLLRRAERRASRDSESSDDAAGVEAPPMDG